MPFQRSTAGRTPSKTFKAATPKPPVKPPELTGVTTPPTKSTPLAGAPKPKDPVPVIFKAANTIYGGVSSIFKLFG